MAEAQAVQQAQEQTRFRKAGGLYEKDVDVIKQYRER